MAFNYSTVITIDFTGTLYPTTTTFTVGNSSGETATDVPYQDLVDGYEFKYNVPETQFFTISAESGPCASETITYTLGGEALISSEDRSGPDAACTDLTSDTPVYFVGELGASTTLYIDDIFSIPFNGSGDWYKINNSHRGKVDDNGNLTFYLECPAIPTPTQTPTLAPTNTPTPTPTYTPASTLTPTPTLSINIPGENYGIHTLYSPGSVVGTSILVFETSLGEDRAQAFVSDLAGQPVNPNTEYAPITDTIQVYEPTAPYSFINNIGLSLLSSKVRYVFDGQQATVYITNSGTPSTPISREGDLRYIFAN